MDFHRYTEAEAGLLGLEDEYRYSYEADEDDLENEWYRYKEAEYAQQRRIYTCAGQRHRGRSSTRPASRRTRGSRRRTASSSSTDPSGDPEPAGGGRPGRTWLNENSRAASAARTSAAPNPRSEGARSEVPRCGGLIPDRCSRRSTWTVSEEIA